MRLPLVRPRLCAAARRVRGTQENYRQTIARVPGAAQHVFVVRCRPGIIAKASVSGSQIANGRNRFAAAIPATTKITSTSVCAIRNGGSDCVGASGFRNGSFWNACTTPTKLFR